MAYIRSLSTRANLLTRQYRSSIGYIHHHHHHDDTEPDSIDKGASSSSSSSSNLFQHKRGFGSTANSSSLLGCFHFSVSPTIGASFSRHMSTTTTSISDVAEVLSDSTLQSQAPAVNEVAIAAADSFFPVAFLQHLIDALHSFTGFNWWVSIVLTTVLIGGAGLPLALHNLKSLRQRQLLVRRQYELVQKIQNGVLDGDDAIKQIKTALKEGGVAFLTSSVTKLFSPIPVFICFFFAISNMAEKVPSLKTGGAYWFLDLSAPDALYIFPVLTALTFGMHMELSLLEKLERQPVKNAGIQKIMFRGLAVLTIPLTMGLPTAFLCYWVTSSTLSSAYKLALMRPTVKKFLGLPQITRTMVMSLLKARLLQMTQRTGTSQVKAGLPQMTQGKVTSQVKVGLPQMARGKVKSQVKVKGKKKNKNR